MQAQPVIIVLAAGHGSRFEGADHKLMQHFGGSTVLGATLTAAVASGLPVVVVARPDLADLAAGQLARRDVVLLEPDATAAGRSGMGTSIAAGVAARGDAAGWLVLPGDMPLVRPETLRAVAAGLEQSPVVYAQFRGRRGHPVAFGPELYSELARLQGDEGARRLVARYPSLAVDVDDPGVRIDIDTKDDLARARHLRERA
ncbi:MAG: NTP transferase domain-containing protein [Aquabacterium sp.]